MAEHKNLAEALLAFQAVAPKLRKDTPAGQGKFSYKYVDLADLREVIRPLLTEHGLVWQTFPCLTPQGEPGLRYKLTHAPSGDCESDVMPLVMSKQDSQAFGSAVTYGRRYAVTAVLDLVADADDDGKGTTSSGDGNKTQPYQAGTDHELPGHLIAAVIAAVKKADMPPDWVRMQFIAAGAQNVPEGAVKLSTVKGLTVEQAKTIIGVCDQHTADKVAP